MKIAMIGHKRVPSREGGVEIVVEELSTRLVKNGHQVDIYNRKGKNVQDKNVDKDKKGLKEYKGIKLITIPTINKKGIDALLYSFFATIKALFGKYDVIHYHAEGPCAMLWIPHLFGIKTVATIHGLDWQRSKWGGFATKYIKFGEKIAAKYADEIIVLSKGVQKYFKDTYNRETNFIPNGVNKPEIKEANLIKEKWGLEKDNYVLFLARIVPEKGLHYLIEAYKQIHTDKKLVIAGGASHTNDYLEQIKEKVKDDNRIIMTGFVQGEEWEELYSNCYLYCLPSDVEGMPISLLEAMSYGCNCLVSDIEENIQVTEEYAATFKKGNVADLKEKLEISLKEENRIKKEEISNRILEKYNWEEIVKKTEKLLQPEKKINKSWIYYFFVICIYGLVFQNFLQMHIPIFKYFDELLAVLGIPAIIYAIKIKDKNLISKYTLIIAISLFLIFFVGIFASLRYKYQPMVNVISDIIVVFKFFFVYYLARIILKQKELLKYKSYILKHIKLIIIFLFVFTIANYTFDIFGGDIRYGIKSNRLFYGHTTYLSAVSVFLLASIILFEEKLNYKYVFMILLVIATTLRAKALAFVAIFIILAIYLIKVNKKLSIFKLMILGIVSIIISFSQIYFYFVEIDDSARSTLLKTSIEIANDYFPTGTGFATYGSHFSTEPYSPIYIKYNIQNIYGLSEDNAGFVSDSFWPMILGQFGYIGFVSYILCIILIFKKVQKNYTQNSKYQYISKIACILYLLISSTAESAFVNPIAIPFAILLGIS